jgi:hypothetical protein
MFRALSQRPRVIDIRSCASALLALLAFLATATPAPAASSPSPGGEALHRLGSDPLQLRFEGETSAKSWPIYVTVAEARTRARVHLGFTNAISVMPEMSTLSVSINDIAVAQTPIAAATDSGALDVELPRGLLTPGYNSVRLTVSQRHRVDCSMEATYELWTQLDPASSGLTFPGLAEPRIDVLDDLAAISPDASGETTIKVALPEDPDANALDNALRAAEAVAIRAGARRPHVEFVDEIGERPGLYVIAGQRDYLRAHGFSKYLSIIQGRVLAIEGQDLPGRVIVVAVGDTPTEIGEAIETILPVRRPEERAETPAAARALTNQFGYPIHEALHVPLHDLGVATEEFTGRLYRAAFDITLPGDFYPADYDKLTLSLTAGYASGLLPSAQILVRVNDREAGSMPMKNPKGAVFRNRPVSVSLSALRPGVNHVVVEAQAPDSGDQTCDVKHLMEARKRFVLFDDSELILPSLARIGRLPNLAATLSSGFPYQTPGDSWVYVAARDPLTLSAVGTYLARTAAVAGRPLAARVTFDREVIKSGSVLFIGALDAITPDLIEAFGVDYRALKESWSRPSAANALASEPGGKAAAGSVDSGQVFDQWADGAHATTEDFSPRVTIGAIYDRYINIHRSDFALLRDPDRKIVAPERATLVLAQAQGPKGGFDTWTLIIGPDEATLARDMQSLVAPSNWNEVEGRAAAFTPRSGARSIAPAVHTYFIPTQTLTPGNVRLIAAGFLSANLDYYVILIVFAAIVLGLATHAAVKAHGNQS